MNESIHLAQVWLAAMGKRAFNPIIQQSIRFFKWIAIITERTCQICETHNQRIIGPDDEIRPKVHPRCKCILQNIKSIIAGTATTDGVNGADYTLKHHGTLPENYVTKEEAEQKGWDRKKKTLQSVLPGAILGGNTYRNDNKVLPDTPDRKWCEADINYFGTKKRHGHRVVYSNDGLIFVTYDHYQTFYEIV